MRTTLVFCFLAFSLFSLASTQKVYDYNATCQKAYLEITRLRIGPGLELIQTAKQQNPHNLIPYMLEGYVDFFVLFFNEDPDEYEKRKDNFAQRQALYDAGPHSTPFYRYCKALNILQRSTVRLKFGERFGAIFDFKKGYVLIKDNKKAYPHFLPNNLVYAPLQVVIGTVPDGYKFYTSLFGMQGSIKEGMALMRGFLNSNDFWGKLYRNEAIFYYAYLSFYIENKQEEVMKLIKDRNLDMVNNHLFTYLGANLGINSKNSAFSYQVLLAKNNSPGYLQTPVWELEKGYTKLYHLEYADAIEHFGNFTTHFKGRFYVKDALMKLSWAYYLAGDVIKAGATRQQVLKKGAADSDADKKAMKDAKTGVWPTQALLKARLLSDGGYHTEALAILVNKTSSDFTTAVDKVEFVYRLGRINDDLGNDTEAIGQYTTAINLGEKMTEYFAARAALQIGYIYEKRGQYVQAITYFQKCIDMDDHEYKDSLDQRAKSGIARCKGQ